MSLINHKGKWEHTLSGSKVLDALNNIHEVFVAVVGQNVSSNDQLGQYAGFGGDCSFIEAEQSPQSTPPVDLKHALIK
jgi:hypothetical protein